MKASLLRASQVRRYLPRRSPKSYKGRNGHVLVVAGNQGMTGAAYLCALGALKAGAGLVTVAGDPAVRNMIAHRLPEAMTIGTTQLGTYVRRRTITTVAVGPGLGVRRQKQKLVRSVLALGVPAVVDADGLNNLSAGDLKNLPIVITPHVGEFSRLTSYSRSQIDANRAGLSQDLAKRLNIVCVLKGYRTVVTNGYRVYLNPTGNPAMATGGMGDVLTGVVSAFLAQGLSLLEAACAGVYIHGLAGDIARRSDRGLLATELALAIPTALRKLGLK